MVSSEICIACAGERFMRKQHEQTLLLSEKANFAAAVLSFAIGRGTAHATSQHNDRSKLVGSDGAWTHRFSIIVLRLCVALTSCLGPSHVEGMHQLS